MGWRYRNQHCLLSLVCLAFCFTLWSLYSARSGGEQQQLRPPLAPLPPAKLIADGQESATQSNGGERRRDGLIGDLPCTINDERTLNCLRDDNDEIYLPFHGFLRKYFDVTGVVERKPDGEEVFHWWHSNAKMQRPTFEQYDPVGVFGSFDTYNVENRDRVKCISGLDGIPLSIQWTSNPYPYPIQIAQYALEHYSKNLTESAPTIQELANSGSSSWRIPPDISAGSFVNTTNAEYIHFKTSDGLENPGVFVALGGGDDNWKLKLFTLRMEIRFAKDSNASFTISMEKLDTRTLYTLTYVQSDELIWLGDGNQIFYGLGAMKESRTEDARWRTICRNLLTDFSKGLALMPGRKNGPTSANSKRASKRQHRLSAEAVRLIALSFRGEGWIRRRGGLTLRSSAHLHHFDDAAKWFLRHQDAKGGWPIPVRRTLADGRLTLEPGWYSAMAQGHAMSVLCRAYQLTGDKAYLDAAFKATHLFHVDASDGGVRSRFMGTDLQWYEEYPTQPPIFVLNGFIYSLIGLYDLKHHYADNRTVDQLYQSGLKSLKAMLPFYDLASVSVYDLRHVTLKIAPNVARWDYHSVHVYQLLWIYLIEKDELFLNTAERWLAYAKGDRAKHN